VSRRDKKRYIRDYKNHGLPDDVILPRATEDLAPAEQWVKPEPPKKIYQIDKNDDRPPHRGRVVYWDGLKNFGFVCAESDLEYARIFFHEGSIIRNQLGHNFILIPGTEVCFTLDEGDDNRFFATDIRLASDNSKVDSEHTEYSRVTKWSREFGHGVAMRSCGVCKILFRATSVVTEGLEFVQVGDWICHNIATDGKSIFAANVTLFETGFVPPEPEPTFAPDSIEAHFAALPDVQRDP
jgi:cold shock CspA family protein